MKKKYKALCTGVAAIAVVATVIIAVKFVVSTSHSQGENLTNTNIGISENTRQTDLSITSAGGVNSSGKTVDLMLGVKAAKVPSVKLSNTFINSMADFSINLFKRSIDKKSSSMVSPYSVLNALAMTANGANGQTLAEMERVLCNGMSISDLNEYMHAYNDSLSSKSNAKFSCANSIWFRDFDGLYIEPTFLQKNADYYGAAIYKAPFDSGTLSDINSWVSKNTNGMVKNLLNEIEDDSMMYLVNATAFDAQWLSPYYKIDVIEGTFNSHSGSMQSVQMLCGTESTYINYGGATGFIKPYKGNEFAFVALLPDAGTDINDYIASLTGKKFIATVKSAQGAVKTRMPKFEAQYSANLNKPLMDMGIRSAFTDGGLTKLGTCVDGDLYVSNVVHKTFISVTENGTKAGAATYVEIMAASTMIVNNEIILDRPFVYAIIDTETNLPIFIGTVLNIK